MFLTNQTPTRPDAVIDREKERQMKKKENISNNPCMVFIENDGPDILRTNYWGSEQEKNGLVHVSLNSRCFRILLPEVLARIGSHAAVLASGFVDAIPSTEIAEMSTAKEIIISRCKHERIIEIMFDDHSIRPYCLYLSESQFFPLAATTFQGEPVICSVWTSKGKAFERPGYYRLAKGIPWMKPVKSDDLNRTPSPTVPVSGLLGSKEGILDGAGNINPEGIKEANLGHAWVRGRTYPSPLPPELEKWYCYVGDAGHCILVVPLQLIKERNPKSVAEYLNQTVPCPVKAVLRGWHLVDGFVVVDMPYEKIFGLIVPEEDDEF